jgi:hypothetical protein
MSVGYVWDGILVELQQVAIIIDSFQCLQRSVNSQLRPNVPDLHLLAEVQVSCGESLMSSSDVMEESNLPGPSDRKSGLMLKTNQHLPGRANLCSNSSSAFICSWPHKTQCILHVLFS